MLDAATGLLYVGNGQYYDPATGRFLTRDARPNSANPYVPWNPIGAIVGPLGLIALVFGRRKKGNKVGTFLALVLVVGSVGMTLAGCGGGSGGENGTGQQPTQPSNQNNVHTGDGTDPGNGSNDPGSGTQTPTLTCTPTPSPTLTSTSTPISTSTLIPTPIAASDLKRDLLKLPGAPNAEKAYDLYLEAHKHTEGWWWTEYGGQDGFTIWEFMAIMWSYDAVLDMPLVREAMHNRAKVFCPGGCEPSTAEGSLRYLTVFAQSGRDRVKNWQPGTDPATALEYNVSDKQAGINIVEAIRTSDVELQDLIVLDP
ncbi:MAG TPA: hypothetical protein VLT51_08555, partial [Anaerolineales bacterium]|nr:hypothetical protein [Anaerolineales bacterium]